MPKAPRNTNGTNGNNGVSQTNNALKRNQACHQCRRRKLKCDAKKPCGTCVRSFNHAVRNSQSSSGSDNVPVLVCTFDELPNSEPSVTESERNHMEKLENRILELEEKLRQQNGSFGLGHDSGRSSNEGNSQPSDGSQRYTPNNAFTPSISVNDHVISFLHSSSSDAMFFPNWPQNLPEPELLHHLVELFFTFYPHAKQLFHAATFMASLVLPPEHPKFPATPVLHAICALASSYTRVVSSAPPVDYSQVPTSEMFTHRYRLNENFSDRQARLSQETAMEQESMGVNLLQIVQANIILSWYFCSHARSAELFLTSARALRLSVPLSLNVCPPFHSIAKTARSASLLPAAKTVIDDETRRNTFWLAYAIERCHGIANGWASSLDDQDIFQLLPVRNDQFQRAELVPPSNRQWSHTRDLLLSHPEDQVDSFILYIKSAILISKVKTFNIRFRARHFTGEESVAANVGANPNDPIDPRNTLTFMDLDRISSSYLSSFPVHLRSPVQGGIVECNLVTAVAISHLAVIVLHEPHAEVQRADCASSRKILEAARAIIELIYELRTTSFDLSLLESFVSSCFYHAGRVLGSFLRVALNKNRLEHVSTLQSQIAVARMACEQMGQRHCLAVRFTKMLDEGQPF